MPSFSTDSTPRDDTPRDDVARTKIVATVGPACREPEQLAALVRAGVDVFRLNMAHGTQSEHDAVVRAIRQISTDLNQPLAILVDLAGPKIRLGELLGGEIHCQAEGTVRFVRGETATQSDELVSSYPRLINELQPGDRILLADATVSLTVESVESNEVSCRVLQSGYVRSRQGINLPGVRLSAPTLGDKDREAALWAASRDVDFLGLSFVRAAEDVIELKELLAANASHASVIAKIEKPEALEQLDAIVSASDGIMIARGDLGVEIDITEVPLAQKRIIESCHRWHRPVIVATQMLASMEHTLHPTRAEVTDVANAILDGGDACMLSGETAVGAHPVEAVRMMNRIAITTERRFRGSPPPTPSDIPMTHLLPVTQAVVAGAAQIARQLDAGLLVVATHSGTTALAMSRQRLFTPVVALSDQEATLRKMCLFWGMTPVRDAPVHDTLAIGEFSTAWAREKRQLGSGAHVVVVTGTGIAPGAHNGVEVHQI